MKEIWYLKALKKAYAWKILEEELKARVQDLEKLILDDFTWKNNEMKYTALDIYKTERKILKDFLELPDNLIRAMDIIEQPWEDE